MCTYMLKEHSIMNCLQEDVGNAGIFGEIIVVVSHKNVLQRGCLISRIKRSSGIETAKVVRTDRNKIIVFLV